MSSQLQCHHACRHRQRLFPILLRLSLNHFRPSSNRPFLDPAKKISLFNPHPPALAVVVDAVAHGNAWFHPRLRVRVRRRPNAKSRRSRRNQRIRNDRSVRITERIERRTRRKVICSLRHHVEARHDELVDEIFPYNIHRIFDLNVHHRCLFS